MSFKPLWNAYFNLLEPGIDELKAGGTPAVATVVTVVIKKNFIHQKTFFTKTFVTKKLFFLPKKKKIPKKSKCDNSKTQCDNSNSKCDKTRKLKMWQNSKSYKTQKLEM